MVSPALPLAPDSVVRPWSVPARPPGSCRPGFCLPEASRYRAWLSPRLLRFFLPALLALAPCLLSSQPWEPVPEEEWNLPVSSADPSADVEATYLYRRIDNSDRMGALSEVHVRLRALNAAGVARLQRVAVPVESTQGRTRRAARVVRRDGSSQAIPEEAWSEEDEPSSDGHGTSRHGFLTPPLQPGDMVEYRIVRTYRNYFGQVRLLLSHEWPVRYARIQIKPMEVPGVTMYTTTFMMDVTERGRDADGFYTFEARDLPARVDEPFAPTRYAVSPWLLMQEREPNQAQGDRFWHRYAADLWKRSRKESVVTKFVRARADALLDGETDPAKQLVRLYDACRHELISTDYDHRRQITPAQEKQIENSDRAEEILQRGYGSPYNINTVFIALARAAGFDARLAYVNDRTGYLFSPNLRSYFAIPDAIAAVKVGDTWQFYNPGAAYYAAGSHRWRNEAGTVLVAGDGEPLFLRVPMAPASFSVQHRTGTFSLDAAGTLTGELEIVYEGHPGAELKEKLDDVPAEKREQLARTALKNIIPGVEVLEVHAENFAALDTPLRLKARVRAVGYAERLGNRLLVRPSVFTQMQAPRFKATERRHDIYFPAPFTEVDRVRLSLPDGSILEAAAAPNSRDRRPLTTYDVSLAVTRGSAPTLIYQREFACLAPKIPQKHYQAVRAVFDEVWQEDRHVISVTLPSAL